MITEMEVNYFKKLQNLLEKAYYYVLDDEGKEKTYANILSLGFDEPEDSTELIVKCDYIVGYTENGHQYEGWGSFEFEIHEHDEYIKFVIVRSIAELTFKQLD